MKAKCFTVFASAFGRAEFSSVPISTKRDESGVGSIHRYTWKSKLPYRLSFDMETIRIEPPRLLEGIATG